MKKLNLILVVLLAVSSVFAAQTKSPVILLQEGLYAEQTEGDLEKAISLYEQVLEQYKDVERLAARATYQLGMCYLKKGHKEKASEYFDEVVSYYPEQKNVVENAQKQLDKMGVSKVKEGNIFDILGDEVCAFIGSKYGEICAEAGMKRLYSNSQIYVVDSDFVLRFGGMGYICNWTGQPITEKHRVSGTSMPSQKLYDIHGNQMDIEIVPDEQRKGFYHIYWNPKEPLGPGEVFNYGCATDGSRKLSDIRNSSVYPLTMQNHFGDHCYETFFLVVPEGIALTSQSEEYTKMKNFQGWDIYWWKKEVPENTSHMVNVSLAKTEKREFPEFEGCRIKETVKLKLDKPQYEWWLKEPQVSKTIYENDKLEITWKIEAEIGNKMRSIDIGLLPISSDVSDLESHLWLAEKLPITVRHTLYGKDWKKALRTGRNEAKQLTPGEYVIYVCAIGSCDSDVAHRSRITKFSVGVAVAKLIVKPTPYTQVSINNIQPDGTIKTKNIIQQKNTGNSTITTMSFINSDFVHIEKIFDDESRPIEFTTKHENDISRYHLTFNEPVMPDEALAYCSEGTITGLIRPVTSIKDEYQYLMRHHPGTNVPTRRIEVFTLPEGAELISTTPTDMARRKKDGRIELFVEEIVHPGGSITTAFQYKLPKAKLASTKPLKLEPAPWVAGEVMRLSINTMSGMEIGTLGYIARLVDINGTQAWSIQGYQIITANNSQQYTQVDAELDSFTPITGRTKNDEGDFIAEYDVNGIELSSKFAHGMEKTQNIKTEHTVYDNEQVLYLLRRLPLKEGFQTSFKIFSIQTGAIVDCRINVTGKETVTAPAGTFDCYKTVLAIYSGTIKALEHKLWFSADNNRYCVKYDSGAAIMKLVETGIQKQGQEQLVTDEQAGLSITLPAQWRFYKNPSPNPYTLSWQLLPPQCKAWAVLTGAQRISAFDSAETVAYMDIEVLKGFFKDYTPRESSWTDLTIDGTEAVSYEADYSDKGGPMVEYRTYILGKSHVYWFVFRVEKDRFKEYKAEFDSIIQSFKLVD